MKVLIDHEWQDFEVKFGEKMPEEIGGVEVCSGKLEDELWADIGYDTFSISVTLCKTKQLLLAQYMHYGVEDSTVYSVRLSVKEFYTYTDRLG